MKSSVIPSPRMAKRIRSPLRRFHSRVSYLPNGCMQWSSVRQSDGYGTWTVGTKCHVPHRWLYEQTIGPVPKGWTLDHVCRNRGCVNVFDGHIEAVPHKENIRRAVNHSSQLNAAKTHCPRGHEYTPENTWARPKPNGSPSRKCKLCNKLRKEQVKQSVQS